MYNAEELIGLLREEIRQRSEEGCKVEGYKRRVHQAGRDVARLEAVYDRLAALKPDRRLADAEPSDLAAIQALRPKGPRRIKGKLSVRKLRDRLRGAFLARCAGCMLGKPVEGWSAAEIEGALKRDKRYPLSGYFEASTMRKARRPIHPDGPTFCTRGNFKCMERDDDTDYTILGIHYLRTYGKDFTTEHVAREWLQRLPYWQVYTAERSAYKNLVCNIPLEQVPVYRNPFREWIGAEIRADGFGYCAAGMPQLAAEFAHRDAALSHAKNGIYGEMLFAAMVAAAVYCDDLNEIIEIGLSEIPADCRLAVAVRDTIEWATENKDWRDTLAAIQKKYGHYSPIHTINNSCLVIMGLLHGKMNLGKTLSMTVMGGWDTDCTGATAGSVLGAMLGAQNLPARWINPLRNRIRSMVVGYDDIQITDVADMAYEVHKKLRR